MTEHTKEPWATAAHGHVLSEDKSVICRAFASNPPMGWPGTIGESERDANARRIVACVNALAGIPTEDLERVGATAEHYPRMVRLAALVEQYMIPENTPNPS